MKNEKTKSLSPSFSAIGGSAFGRDRAGRYEFAKEVNRVKGFTLIELLVAISIIATLTAVLLPNFMGARERAKDAQKISDLGAVKNALRMYYNEHQAYPVGFTTCTDLSATLVSYLPGMSGIGCTYSVDATGETFDLCVGLDSGSGDEDVKSQINCGATAARGVCGLSAIPAITRDKLFVVCAK